MDELLITPRFSETDALGHISNTTLPVWFEAGREGLFRRLHPSLSPEGWPMILARYEVDLKRQLFLGTPVAVRTGIEHLGNSSLRVYQEAGQDGQLAATGRTVLVHFDYAAQRPKPIGEAMRAQLADLLLTPGEERP